MLHRAPLSSAAVSRTCLMSWRPSPLDRPPVHPSTGRRTHPDLLHLIQVDTSTHRLLLVNVSCFIWSLGILAQLNIFKIITACPVSHFVFVCCRFHRRVTSPKSNVSIRHALLPLVCYRQGWAYLSTHHVTSLYQHMLANKRRVNVMCACMPLLVCVCVLG